jgi:hypothetical protein
VNISLRLQNKEFFPVPKLPTQTCQKQESRKSHTWAPLKVLSNVQPDKRVVDLEKYSTLKGLSHEIDFKNVDSNLQNLALLRDASGF